MRIECTERADTLTFIPLGYRVKFPLFTDVVVEKLIAYGIKEDGTKQPIGNVRKGYQLIHYGRFEIFFKKINRTMEIKTKVFANQYKTNDPNDAKDKKRPDYQVKDKNSGHDVAIWKNDDGSLYVQVKPTENR